MAPRPARTQVRPARRGQAAKALRARLTARAAQASARARAPAARAPMRPAQRVGRVRPEGQRAGLAGGGDESDSEDSRILDPAGGDDRDAEHPDSGDESGGDDAALPGEPVGAIARLGARSFRVRLVLGGHPAPGGHLAQGGVPAAVDLPPPLRACEHCHTIPYHKGVCCSNVGVRTECHKCHAMVWQGALSKRCRVHCLCAQGTQSMYSGALFMSFGGTVHELRGHCP